MTITSDDIARIRAIIDALDPVARATTAHALTLHEQVLALKALVAAPPPPPDPTYTLEASAREVPEGGSVTITLRTTGVAAGTAVGYSITGVSTSDLDVPLDGALLIGQDGTARIFITPRADATTEGDETMTISAGPAEPIKVRIVDASVQPPLPPPAPGTRIEVRGPNIKKVGPGEANNFDNGIPDFIDVSSLPGPVPWEVYADDRQTIAPSRGGVEALHLWQRFHVFGHTQGLYQPMPRMVDGQLRQIYPNAGNFPDHAALKLRLGPSAGGEHLVHGPRGVSVPTPYTTWHGHTRREGAVVHESPEIPLYVGITLHGHMVYAMRDGSMRLAGIVPVESWSNDFSFFDADRKVFFYTDTGKGRVMRVDRRTTPWTVTTLAEGFRQADSCRAVGSTLYVTDSVAGEVWGVDTATGAKRLVCRLPQAFWVDYFSDGTLAVAKTTLAVHRIDPATGTVGPNITPSGYVQPAQAWVTVDVDRWGHMGEVDTFVVLGVTASSGGFHRVSKTGAVRMPEYGKFGNAAGPVKWVGEPWGHYPWTGAHHPDEALLLTQGMANLVPQIVAVVERPGWVGMKNPDSHAGWYALGRNIALLGDTGPRLSTRYTTLLPQLAAGGGGLITADHMAHWTHDRLREFLLAGCLGVQPRAFDRDAVQGWGMCMLMHSQRYLLEGWPLVQRWVDYCRALPA